VGAVVIVGVVLAAFTASVYLAVVAGAGMMLRGQISQLLLVIVATTLVGASFGRVRDAAKRWAAMLLNQPVADPGLMFGRIAMAGAGTQEAMVQELTQAMLAATGAREVTLHLDLSAAGDVVLPVRHDGELLGAFVLNGVALKEREHELLAGLAAHAGLVLRNARLTASLKARLEMLTLLAQELTEARLALVSAADRERERLAGDLKDQATLHLEKVVAGLNDAEPGIEPLRGHVDRALAEVRRISHGLRG
jgi:signal transduction histidine kinase